MSSRRIGLHQINPNGDSGYLQADGSNITIGEIQASDIDYNYGTSGTDGNVESELNDINDELVENTADHETYDAHLIDTSNPHTVYLEQARSENATLQGDIDFNDNNIVDILGMGFKDGETITWNHEEYTLNIPTGLGPILQTGQETYVLIYNNTGAQITNGTVLRPVGLQIVNGINIPTVEKAQSNVFSKCEGTIFMATMDVPNNSVGIATRFGRVRGTDTTHLTPGATAYIDAGTAGLTTNTLPAFPNYDISIGAAFDSQVDGEFIVSVTRSVEDTTINFWNGVFRESFDFRISSDGSTITGALGPANGHPDMTMIFSTGLAIFDTSPAATIALTGGSDTIPQSNYVYILESNKILAVSTGGWPTTAEHIKVCQCYLQSALTTQTDGALKNQNWNDEICDTNYYMGHVAHIGERIRQDDSKWDTGCHGAAIDDLGSFWVTITAGYVYQMHRQSFPVFDTETGDHVHVINDSVTPFVTVSDLTDITLDASGDPINNTSFSLVLWGVSNKTDEASQLMINLPSATYNKNFPETAVSDANNYSVYSIPKEFQGVGFLISRFTFVNDGGVWSLYDTEDLRGYTPNTAAGGGAGGTGVTTWLALSDTPSSYAGQAGKFPTVNSGEDALEFSTIANITDTDDVPEGSSNLYYTEARVDANTTVVSKADVSKTILTKSAAYTMTAGDIDNIVECTGTFTLTLPALTQGYNFSMVNMGTGVITLSGNINGGTANTVTNSTQYSAVGVYYSTSSAEIAIGELD